MKPHTVESVELISPLQYRSRSFIPHTLVIITNEFKKNAVGDGQEEAASIVCSVENETVVSCRVVCNRRLEVPENHRSVTSTISSAPCARESFSEKKRSNPPIFPSIHLEDSISIVIHNSQKLVEARNRNVHERSVGTVPAL